MRRIHERIARRGLLVAPLGVTRGTLTPRVATATHVTRGEHPVQDRRHPLRNRQATWWLHWVGRFIAAILRPARRRSNRTGISLEAPETNGRIFRPGSAREHGDFGRRGWARPSPTATPGNVFIGPRTGSEGLNPGRFAANGKGWYFPGCMNRDQEGVVGKASVNRGSRFKAGKPRCCCYLRLQAAHRWRVRSG